MKFIWRFYCIPKRKVYLEKINNLPKHHGAGPQRRGAQCSCIGCIGLRPALYARIENRHEVRKTTFNFLLCIEVQQTFSFHFSLLRNYQLPECFHV